MDETQLSEIAGLLGINPEKLRQQQQMQGLLSAGLNILAASGPSAQPRSLGQIIGQGGMAGIQAYQEAGQRAIETGVQGLKIAELKTSFQNQQKFRDLSKTLYKPDGTLDITVLNQLGQIDPTKAKAMIELGQAGQPKLETLSEGATGYMWNPTTRKFEPVAAGAPKSKLTGDMANVANRLGLPADPATWTKEQNLAFDQMYANIKNVQNQDPTRVIMLVDEIRRGWAKETEPDTQVAQRFKSLSSNVSNPTPVGDTAIIYSFAKILNPGEAIMEGDIRNILSNRSIPDKVKQSAQKAIKGENLTEDERIEIQTIAYKIAKDRAESTSKSYNTRTQTLNSLGDRNPQATITNPYADLQKPPIISVNFKGKKTRAKLSPQTGKYYVQMGNDFYEVAE
jgi:hypothetical protein